LSIYHDILKKYWGYSQFRPLQEDIIKSVASGHDTLGLMPTGGGKSITFQVPALASEGVCLVVTPLIALMKDQVSNLVKKGINAIAIYSGLSKHEIDVALDNCIYGNVKFLYISPERLGSDLFIERVKKMNVSLIAVDESHCISQWGYDFRPSYLRIAEIRDVLPYVSVLALTATATPLVVDDIQEKLRFVNKNVFRKSFERKNLAYIVRHVEDKMKYLNDIIDKVKGTGVVYVRNRRRTKEIAAMLIKKGISADFYHAGLDNLERERKQNDWQSGRTRIIVSTNAFGMGIDKPDVRFVAHIDLPDSLEAYFQEAGRGGRDEKPAYAVLLYHDSDKAKLEDNFEKSFPDIKEIKQVYAALGNYYKLPVGAGKGLVFDFNIRDFAFTFKFDMMSAYSALKFLQREGYVELTDEIDNPSKVMFLMSRDDLYKFQVANSKFDGFIKLLLRTYTGIFTEYVKTDEEYLAKKGNTTALIISQMLQYLNNQKVIRYIPRKKTPLIIYTEERIDEKNLMFSGENYALRKKKHKERIDEVIYYASTTEKCRSQILLSYFGQKNPSLCGHCDICKKHNESGLTNYEFVKIQDEIKAVLKTASMDIDDLIAEMSFNKDKVLKAIRWMLENSVISYSDDYKIKLS